MRAHTHTRAELPICNKSKFYEISFCVLRARKKDLLEASSWTGSTGCNYEETINHRRYRAKRRERQRDIGSPQFSTKFEPTNESFLVA